MVGLLYSCLKLYMISHSTYEEGIDFFSFKNNVYLHGTYATLKYEEKQHPLSPQAPVNKNIYTKRQS